MITEYVEEKTVVEYPLGELPPVAKTPQVATYLQTSPRSVLRLADEKRLRGFQFVKGGAWRFLREDVVEFVDECKRQAANA